MVEAVPRAYTSALRTRQAEETRSRIIAAAARLFATKGYQATTIAAIAREAGVSAETVKTTAAKADLLIAAFEITFSGSEGADSLTDTEVAAGLLAAPDDVFLDSVLTQITTANARGHGLWTVVLGAALSDPVVDQALHRILTHRRDDYRGFVAELVHRGIAPADTDTEATADALSFLLSPESYQQLVVQSGWAPARYAEWLRAVVHAEIAGR